MTLPRQKTPRDKNRRSQAPYNFVPLPDEVYIPDGKVPDQSRFDDGLHSGHIDITLTTETPLYTRAGVAPEYAAAHPEMNRAVWDSGSQYRAFFHHGNPAEPVIPGSSLRGMIRQLVEILSESRLTTAPKRPIVYRAVGDPTRFGWSYRRRFVGPNTDPANTLPDGAVNPNPRGFPQRLEYPVRRPDPNNRWKQFAVHGGYLFRRGRDWFIRPAKKFPEGSEESFVHVDERFLPKELTPWRKHLGVRHVWVEPAAPGEHEHQKQKGEARSKKQKRNLALVYSRTAREVRLRQPGGASPWSTARAANLVITDGLEGKHMHCAIFQSDETALLIGVPDDIRVQYLEDAGLSRSQERRGRLLPETPPEEANCESNPCFYMVNASGKLVFFGGTLFFRLPYRQKPCAFVPRKPDGLDFTTRLFGTARGAMGDEQGFRGRVRFEDLVWKQDGGPAHPFEEEVSPAPLLQPKPACIQHYLVQTDEDREKLRHYDDPAYEPASSSGEATVLRGFKLYWHRRNPSDNPAAAPKDVGEQEHRTRTVIRPVRKGITFEGRIHFDNLTNEEFGALLLALDLPFNLRHKLGMARPFGFGSVKITRRAVRIADPQARYRTFFSQPGSQPLPEASALEAGFASNSEEHASRAKATFARTMVRHCGEPIGNDASDEEAVKRFWSSPRMQELAALLEWEKTPDPESTRPVNVAREDDHAEQWRHRWILPPPHAVLGRSDPWGASTAPHPPERGGTSRPAGSAVPRSAGSDALPEQQTWRGARLAFNAGGGGVLTANHEGRKAEARGGEAARLLQTLSDEDRAKLQKKRKSLTADVDVCRAGNAWRIEAVRAQRPVR